MSITGEDWSHISGREGWRGQGGEQAGEKKEKQGEESAYRGTLEGGKLCIMIPFYRYENWGSETSSYLSEVRQ